MRVPVVAQPSLFEEAIEALLAEDPDLEIVGRETDPHQAVGRIRECHPDVVIVADGEGETALEVQLLRLVREGFPMSIVEVHLETNTLCFYWGERQSIQGAGDLADTIHRICAALPTEAQVPPWPAMGEMPV